VNDRDATVSIRLGVPAVVVAALLFAATIAMFAGEESDVLLVVAAVTMAAVLTGVLFGIAVLVRGGRVARRGLLLAAVFGGLVFATPVPWEWGPHSDDTGWIAVWETPRLVVSSAAAPLVPYVSDTLD
jgi:hypothetical protein